MSHGAGIVTKATMGAAKGALTQAEVWDKIGDIQKGLSGLSSQLGMLDKALRTHAPSTPITRRSHGRTAEWRC